jgi:peptidoglycan/LPS O-acetylase OafA/YrhL
VSRAGDSSHKRETAYLPQLDALRAFSVIAVIYQHYGNPVVNSSTRPGILGVRLFFVISGFLITGILLRLRDQVDGGQSSILGALRVFYVRRFFRIFPAYYFLLFAAAILAVPTVRESFSWHFFYASNYYYAKLGAWDGPVSHFWSLAVEEQFYLLWPLLILLSPRRHIPVLLIIPLVIAPISRLLLITSTSNVVSMSTPLPSCIDSLGCGAMLAFGWKVGSRQGVGRWLQIALIVGWVGTAVLLVCKAADTAWRLRMALTDSFAALVFVDLVHRVGVGVTGKVGRLLESRILVYIGSISYGIYLYHNLVAWLFSKISADAGAFISSGGTLPFLIATLVSVILASLSWYAIERPCNLLKERFSYAPRGERSVGRASDLTASE